ncbi:MAG: amino acid adenylation domain-containing protein [Nitrospirales bacterium]
MAQTLTSIPQKPEGALAPLSLSQQRLWFLYQLDPQSPEYNSSRAWRLKGSLHTEALVTSLNLILARHDVLRTIFREIDGQPVQVIQPTLTAPFQERDWSAYAPAQLATEIDRFLIDEPHQPFDLLTGPLLRFTLLRCRLDDHVLIFTVHHIVFDGTSLKNFCHELSQCYQATLHRQPLAFSPLPIQYQDYAHWQQTHVTDEKLASLVVFWKNHLHGAPLVLELPSDGARPKDTSGPRTYQTFTLTPHVLANLKQLIQPQGITMFMALLAVFQILLSRYTGQRDILVGTPITGRTHTDLENLIGFLVNTLVLRIQIVGHPTFHEVLRQVRKTCLEAYRYQDLPFEKLVEVLKPVRDPSRSPVVQAIFQLRQRSDRFLSFPEVNAHLFPEKKQPGNFDLHMVCEESESGIQGFLYYPQELYSASMMANFAKHYEILLKELIANPRRPVDQISFLSEAETHQQLFDWNATSTDYPRDTCLHDLVQQQALRRPDAIVLVYQEQQMTYRELTRRANQLANYLLSLGVGPEVRVGLCHERSSELIIGLLGIMQAGGTYVPLDPTYPLDRLQFMTHDAQIQIVVTQEDLESLFPQESLIKVSLDRDGSMIATQAEMKPTLPLTSNSLAYVLYTSGSSGKPKGVQIEHKKVVNFLIDVESKLKNSEPDIILTTTSFSFDISIFEVFGPLAFGGRLILASQAQARDGHQLVEAISLESVTKMLATPSGWRLLLEANWEGKPDLVILTGGEALSEELANQLLKCGAALWNLYGPTETTIFSTCTRIVPSEKLAITIGSPIANTQMYIVNTEYLPVPLGVPGELYIGGDGLSRGYLHRPDLTAERFLPDPFSQHRGGRLYRTGDRAKYRTNGNIEYLGRFDHQVKMRGYRIELGEIESLLLEHPEVRNAVVLCREDRPGEKQLVAYLEKAPKVTLAPATIGLYLHTLLPDYMVPIAFVLLDQLPLTLNGKVDRQALPPPNPTHRPQDPFFMAPRTEVEELVVGIWKEVIHLDQVSVHDNFFDLGGHSLLGAQLIARLNDDLQIHLPLRVLFDHPLLEDQARVIEEHLLQGFEQTTDSECN